MTHPFSFGSKTLPGLAKVTEEAGELVQVCGKLMMTGGAGDHWDGSNLYMRLLDEMADMEAAILFFKQHNFSHGVAHWNAYANRVDEKVGLFEKWHKEQAQ